MDLSTPKKQKRDISSKWFHALVESALDAIVTMDNKGRIIAFNPAAERIFGYSADQVVGHRVSDKLIPLEIRNIHEKGLAQFLLKIHCHKGYEILKPVNFPWPVAEIALQHHEHLDGSGYPQKLFGDEILLEARIGCVVDVVESLTAHRPFRPAYTIDEALSSLNRKAGEWYEKGVVDACNRLFRTGYRIDTIDMIDIPRIKF